jgi:hypothetical protein
MPDSTTEQSKEERAASVARQLEGEAPPVEPAVNPPSTANPAEGTGDAGESKGRSGEEIVGKDGKEPGREDTGQSPSGRPKGESDARDATGINPQQGKTDSPPMGGTGGH